MGWQKRLLNLPQVELLELRNRLGFETPIHTPKPTIEQCLTPAERCRSDKFREMCKMQADPSKPWLADINQNQGWTTTGPAVPTVTRNMILYEYNHDHLMISAEMLLSQGHPVMSHGPVRKLVTCRMGMAALLGAQLSISLAVRIALPW